MPLTATHWGLWPARDTPLTEREAQGFTLLSRHINTLPGRAGGKNPGLSDPLSYRELLLSPTLRPSCPSPCKWQRTILFSPCKCKGEGGEEAPYPRPLPSLSSPLWVPADNRASQGPSVASEHTLSQFLRLIPKPTLGSLQFNASLRTVIPSLCPLLALSPALSLPLPQLKILHIWTSVFSPPLSWEMGPPPRAFASILLLNKNWAGGALFTYYLFKSSPFISYRAVSVSGCLGTASRCLLKRLVKIFHAFVHLQNSILLPLFCCFMLYRRVRIR